MTLEKLELYYIFFKFLTISIPPLYHQLKIFNAIFNKYF